MKHTLTLTKKASSFDPDKRVTLDERGAWAMRDGLTMFEPWDDPEIAGLFAEPLALNGAELHKAMAATTEERTIVVETSAVIVTEGLFKTRLPTSEPYDFDDMPKDGWEPLPDYTKQVITTLLPFVAGNNETNYALQYLTFQEGYACATTRQPASRAIREGWDGPEMMIPREVAKVLKGLALTHTTKRGSHTFVKADDGTVVSWNGEAEYINVAPMFEAATAAEQHPITDDLKNAVAHLTKRGAVWLSAKDGKIEGQIGARKICSDRIDATLTGRWPTTDVAQLVKGCESWATVGPQLVGVGEHTVIVLAGTRE